MKSTIQNIVAKSITGRRFVTSLPALQYRYAVTRELNEHIADQALCYSADRRASLDLELAKQQHQELVAAIKSCGIERVYSLPSDNFPDSVFIEDTAVVANGRVLITNPGADERRGETRAVQQFFQEKVPSSSIKVMDKGCLDGGDVLFTGVEFIVGESKRTNQLGIISLQLAFPTIPVYFVNMESLASNSYHGHVPLHLKSFSSLLAPYHLIVGDEIGEAFREWIQTQRHHEENTILALLDHYPEMALDPVDRRRFYELFKEHKPVEYRFVSVPDQEAANVVYINGTILRRASEEFPRSSPIFDKIHIPQKQIQASELSKVDGALSCCSVLF